MDEGSFDTIFAIPVQKLQGKIGKFLVKEAMKIDDTVINIEKNPQLLLKSSGLKFIIFHLSSVRESSRCFQGKGNFQIKLS